MWVYIWALVNDQYTKRIKISITVIIKQGLQTIIMAVWWTHLGDNSEILAYTYVSLFIYKKCRNSWTIP